MKTGRPLHSIWLVLWLFSAAISGRSSDLNLMPLPESVTPAEGMHRIRQSLDVSFAGCDNARVRIAARRLLERLEWKTGIPRAPRQTGPAVEPPSRLTLRCLNTGDEYPSLEMDESYTLDISPESILLEASSPVGILRGMETLLQLVTLDTESYYLPCVRIADRPRFAWRGLHIDASRHWAPLDVILRNLDAMAAVKMNILHWHLSNDHGFRVESRLFPKLHEIGSEGLYYTQEQIRYVVDYARDRGIRVVPEFDIPGHTTAWLAAYPELASAPGPFRIERSWGVFDPCMDPTREEVYAHLDAFIGEMAVLFPDAYFHIGGDEVNGKQWNITPRIREFKAQHGMKSNRELQGYFSRRMHSILAKHGKKMVGWDEILHQGLPVSVTVQTWSLRPSFAENIRRGYPGILSRGYYLDHMRPASYHYGIDPASHGVDESGLILGGEACMWAEFVNEETIESRIWPRAAAIAERLWSPATVQDVADMHRRLELLDAHLDMLGVRHRSGYIHRLRRMTSDCKAEVIGILAEALQPRGLGERQRARKYTSATPLNRLVDVIPPESEAARRFDELVRRALGKAAPTSENFREIRQRLECWRTNARQAAPILERSFLLAENIPVARDIESICALGLQALESLEVQKPPARGWMEAASQTLRQSESSQKEMKIALIPSIEKLVAAAGGTK